MENIVCYIKRSSHFIYIFFFVCSLLVSRIYSFSVLNINRSYGIRNRYIHSSDYTFDTTLYRSLPSVSPSTTSCYASKENEDDVSLSAYRSVSNCDDVDGLHEELTSNDISHITIVSSSHTSGSGGGSSSSSSSSSSVAANGFKDDDATISVPTAATSGVKEFSADTLSTARFASIFRSSAPYIAQHRGSIVVIHIGGHVHQNKATLDTLIDDISILHLLGVYIVLVVGVKYQLDERLKTIGKTIEYYKNIRITDHEALKCLKDEAGRVRFDIESSLARGFRGKPGQSGINVVSGNYFYSAKPLGVRDGIDYKLTGEVRKIEDVNIRTRLESGDVVMLTSLGYSPSGEVFNVQSESLAAECASRLKASKIIYLTNGEAFIDNRTSKHVQSFRLAQAISLLKKYGINEPSYNQIENISADDTDDSYDSSMTTTATAPHVLADAPVVGGNGNSNNSLTSYGVTPILQILAKCVHALTGGVKRAHLIDAVGGALLKELYTRDGAGILISRDVYEGVRQATAGDVRAVEEIIRPLEDEGILVKRSRDQLEKDMPDCFLLTRDGTTLACGMLKRYGDTHAEVCCLAVHPQYRREGRGETLLAYLERRALLMGISNLFVLSTRTMQWFEERGFELSDPDLLPPTRSYNASRGSKVYIKHMSSQRDVDAEEVLWNM